MPFARKTRVSEKRSKNAATSHNVFFYKAAPKKCATSGGAPNWCKMNRFRLLLPLLVPAQEISIAGTFGSFDLDRVLARLMERDAGPALLGQPQIDAGSGEV